MDVINYLLIIFSGVVAVSTAIYTYLTSKLLQESKETRHKLSEPNIVVYFEHSEANASNVWLVIENKGLGMAYDVSFYFVQDIQSYLNNSFKISEYGIVKNGIKTFPTGKKYRYYITSLVGASDKKLKEKIIIEVKYKSVFGDTFQVTYHLPLSEMLGFTISNKDTYSAIISDRLKKIHKTMNDILDKLDPSE